MVDLTKNFGLGMSILTLHLVRHGETTWNAEGRCQGQSESELNEKGREQAASICPELEALDISAIYCSTSKRTRQTMEIAARNLSSQPNFRDDLREIMLGSWETRLWQELDQEWPEQVDDFRHHPQRFQLDGAETYAQLQQRGMSAIEQIIERESASGENRNILVVSHGALIKATLAGFAQVELSQLTAQRSLENCSRSVIAVEDETNRQVLSVGGVDWQDTQWARLGYA